jgi:5,10-methenyltetrahydrofolate synthetase
MSNKEQLRKRYYKIRKRKYFEVKREFFKPLIILLNKFFKKKTTYLSFYYPSNYEVNIIKLLDLIAQKKNIKALLPIINSKDQMRFVKWEHLDVLRVNKYGMLEPNLTNKSFVPNVALIPLLAFDKDNYRLGYGKGYYDKFLNKYLKLNKNILTIGVAFSFQKYNKLPISNFDVKLNYILTEKGITK